MKLFGHPIHPLMIHFPTALLPMDLVLSILSYTKNDLSYQQAGYYCLAGGVLTGFAAVLTGLIELLGIPRNNKPAWALGLFHGFFNAIIILVFAVIAYKARQDYPRSITPPLATLFIKGILVSALFVGNYIGGKLIYQHHIGININKTEHGNPTIKKQPVH